ncbi:thioesterase family protein [Variovorax sp. J22P168]|uniref:acyl-CoA thioesterase n=1 Tax=Variovorax jilinensis TaxID=3053513 RepID=UPI00257677C9|nr:thioesterase family protein [Variovorax sp. J22P168]MDM0011136.1 thioesterase family protein [Variovorax sp. J22P168]
MNKHPLDRALALAHSDLRVGQFTGATSPDYWNMVGPFGGTTAAVMLQAVLRHPDLLGEPVALTVNYAAAVLEGEFELVAVPIRTNRSTQHWTVQMSQAGPDGKLHVTTTGTVFTAVRRETWGTSDLPMPEVPRPEAVERLSIGPARAAWLQQYEMRPILGLLPAEWNGSGDASETRMWVRDAEPRPLDFAALAALSDAFFPRVWLRRATPVPIGTVSITTYFHVDSALLAEIGHGFLLGRATGQQFRNGYFDQAAQLWSEAGVLLATSNQIVYFKE